MANQHTLLGDGPARTDMEKLRGKRVQRWLWQQRSAAGKYLPLAVFLGVMAGLLLVLQTFWLAGILHGAIIDGQPVMAFAGQLMAILGALVLRALLVYGRERFSFAAGRALRQQLRHAVLDKLERLGPVFIQTQPAGQWSSLLLEQVESLHDYYARYLPQLGLTVCLPLLILVAIFPHNWAAAAILLCTAPLIPLFMTLVGMGASEAHRKHFLALQRLSVHFLDRLQGLATLKLFLRAGAEEAAIAKASDEFRQRTMAVLRMAFLSSAVLEFFAAISIAVLALYFGFSYLGELNFGHSGGKVSLFAGLLALMLAPEFFQPLRDLGTHYHARAQAVGAAKALMNLLQTPETRPAGCLPLPQDLAIRATDLVVHGPRGQPLVGPLSFELGLGERLVVIGPSGAGKSSLLNALLGFMPYAGSLQVGGVELKDIDPAAWRANLAWLGQEPQLFHGSLRENVALAQPQIPDEALWPVLEEVGMAEFVRGLPQGLDYSLGERNAGVSVGQAQRLALARALLQQAQLFVLDEPTASLDARHEEALLAALAKATLGKSCVLATHRLEYLRPQDQVLVLEQGARVRQGRWGELATEYVSPQAPGLAESGGGA